MVAIADRLIFLFLIPGVLAHGDGSDIPCDVQSGKCDLKAVDVADEGIADDSDELVLLQRSHIQATRRQGDAQERTLIGVGAEVKPVIEYFMRWSQGKLAQLKKTEFGKLDAALLDSSAISMVELFERERSEKCPHIPPLSQWEPHDERIDNDGVHHAVVSSPSGLRYLAGKSGSLAASDPPVCAEKASKSLIYLDRDREAGEEEDSDIIAELPQACLHLAHKTARKSCGRNFNITALWAHDEIINGVRVTIAAKFSSGTEKSGFHEVECDFQTKPSEDAKLVQIDSVAKGDGATKGLIPSLRLSFELCKADEYSTLKKQDKEAASVMLQYGLGDLSSTKGFEHVNDGIPMATDMLEQEPPSDIDFRTKYEACFPDNGKEVVRNQGNCGSCWAFGVASAAMNNLCISNNGAEDVLASASDRFEVSVQQILSCNQGKRGCNGGWAQSGAEAWEKNGGIHKERDIVYQCGGGDPLNHFEGGGDCKSWPWGKQCSSSPPVRTWISQNGNWLQSVDGEANMITQIVKGRSMYVSFSVYSNFMSSSEGGWTKGSGENEDLYIESSGQNVGGHAVTCMGYGVDNGIKYWHIQNSWGKLFSNNGYCRFKRGGNFCGIEDGSYVPTVLVGTPTEAPTAAPGQCAHATMTSGNGKCWLGGDCCAARLKYSDAESCSFAVGDASVNVEVKSFDTEARYDYLEVNDEQYTGKDASGLSSSPLAAGTVIKWSSDSVGKASGWQICLSPTDAPSTTQAPSTAAPTEGPTDAPTESPTDAPTESPTDAPTESPTDAPTESPTEEETEAPTEEETEAPTEEETEAPTEEETESPSEGPTDAPTECSLLSLTSATPEAKCAVDAQCCASSLQYGNSENCRFMVGSTPLKMSVEQFATEESYDRLSVWVKMTGHSTKIDFNGLFAKEQIESHTAKQEEVITWSSDESMTTAGWKVCFSAAA